MDQLLGTRPRVCFEVEKIINVSSDGNVQSFQVQWAPAWVSSFHLVGCEHLIQEFLQRQSQKSNQSRQTEKENMKKSNGGTVQVSSLKVSETYLAQSNHDTMDPDPNTLPSSPQHRYEDDSHVVEPFCQPQLEEDIVLVDVADTTLIKIEDDITADNTDAYQTNIGQGMSENSEHLEIVVNSSPPYTTDNDHFLTLNPKEKTVKGRLVIPPRLHSSSDEVVSTELPLNKQIYQDAYSARKHNCGVCGKQLPTPSGLRIHMRTHTGDRPYTCEYCNRGFTQNGHLQRHLRMHAGIKPFVCDVCGKGFTRKRNMKQHRALSHSNDDDNDPHGGDAGDGEC